MALLIPTCTSTIQLQLKVLQTCKLIFLSQENELSVHFIHALGPEVVRLVEEGVRGEEGDSVVIVEATQVLEGLLDATPEEKSEFSQYYKL